MKKPEYLNTNIAACIINVGIAATLVAAGGLYICLWYAPAVV